MDANAERTQGDIPAVDDRGWRLLLATVWWEKTPVRWDWWPMRDLITIEKGFTRTEVARTEVGEDGVMVVRWNGGKSPHTDPMTARVESRVRLLYRAQQEGRMCRG